MQQQMHEKTRGGVSTIKAFTYSGTNCHEISGLRVGRVLAGLIMGVFLLTGQVAAQPPRILHLTNGDWPPYLSPKLPHNGFISQVVTRAFHREGIQVEFSFFPWNRAYQYARAGRGSDQEWHGSVAWIKTPEREVEFIFSAPVVIDQEVLFHLKTRPLTWTRLSDLQDKIICAPLHTALPALEYGVDKGLFFIDRCGKYDRLLHRLIKARCDAAPMVKQVGMYYLKTRLSPAEQAQITWSPHPLSRQEYHLIISRKLPRAQAIVDRFNQGLEALRADGTYDRLWKQLEAGGYAPIPSEGQHRPPKE